MHLWVREFGHSFSHDGWLIAVTVRCSKVSLKFLHCSGELVRYSWSKAKIVSFQVSTPALKVSLSFGIQAWFISRLFLTSVLLGLGGFPLVPLIRDLQFITFRWVG